MAPTIPSSEPSRLVAGDTWLWTRPDHAEYPISEGWTLSYLIRGLDIPNWSGSWVTNDGSLWTVTIPAGSTNLTVSGASSTYTWTAFMAGSGSYTGRRHAIASGLFIVLLNPASAAAGDLANQDERDLAAVNAVINRRITADIQNYMIGGRQLVKIPIADLYRIRSILESRIWRARNPGQIGPAVAHRFVSP